MTTTQDQPRATASHYGVRRCSGCASYFHGAPVVGARAAHFRRYEDRLGTDAHDVGWSTVGDGGLGVALLVDGWRWRSRCGAAGRAWRRDRGRLGDPGADGVTVDCIGENKSFVTFPIHAAHNY